MSEDLSRSLGALMRLIVITVLVNVALLVPIGSAPCAQPGVRRGFSSAGLSIEGDEGRPYFGREIEWLLWGRAPGLHLGAFYHFGLFRNIGILGELSYVRRGMSGDTHFLFDDVKYRVAIDYLELPVPLTINVPVGPTLGAVMLAGPYGAMRLGARRLSCIDGVTERVDLPNVRRFDYGFVLGISPALSVRGQTITIDLRYYHGLASIMDPLEGSAPAVSSESTSIKSRAFSVLLGIRL